MQILAIPDAAASKLERRVLRYLCVLPTKALPWTAHGNPVAKAGRAGSQLVVVRIGRFLKNPLVVCLAVLVAIAGAFQVAGVTSMPLAKIILALGVWVFLVIETSCSIWVRTCRRYAFSVILAVTCATGLGSVYIARLISNMKVAQTSVAIPKSEPPIPAPHTEGPKKTKSAGPKSPRDSVKIPDAALEITQVSDPHIALRNVGSTVLREPRYTLTLASLDTAKWGDNGILPVLRTNVANFTQNDWLRPGDGFGGFAMFDDGHKPLPMSRIFGWASCSCPTCARERWYLLYLVFGAEGWYYEIPKGESINRVFFNSLFGKSREDQDALLRVGIPLSDRKQLTFP